MTAAPPQADFRSGTLRGIAWKLLAASGAVGVAGAIAFYLVPEIDISVSRLFYSSGQPPFANAWYLDLARNFFFAVFALACLLALVGYLVALVRGRPWLNISGAKWLYLVACLGIGPGLIGNYALKNEWGRARPTQIVEFGGSRSFTPPLVKSNQCDRNCSFVAGEASTLFILGFAGAFLFPHRARRMIGAGIALGTLAGLVRIAQGAHFLSDVVFAGVIMGITAALLSLLFAYLGRSEPGAANDTPNPVTSRR